MAEFKESAKTFAGKFKEGKGIFAVLNPAGALVSYFKKTKSENEMTDELRNQYQERLTDVLEGEYQQSERNNTPYLIAAGAIAATIALFLIFKNK